MLNGRISKLISLGYSGSWMSTVENDVEVVGSLEIVKIAGRADF